ncbi:ABC transporter ATP-binding protein [Blastococcus brunescens]|uniref:ATP-binding cassette domain-containing protein n=1 Tax=Blastococcus brunescens TaxID=1564165 RepID=A0ABZ1B1Z7_9ACTN|nr:ATP-binding cassette domain-containing protein [Blastococcus sp. BMG 8361]WRL64837.1 ATP-binding cassette domain-containing protein [Blastococcus sp. BMG 8361]
MTSAISLGGLTKRYGETVVLDGVDLDVGSGTVCALLGPNGAGKTTAVRIMTTLVRPDAGRVEVAGIDVVRHPRAVRRRIGLIGQQPAVDDVLAARQNLVLFGRLHHLCRRDAGLRAEELLEQVGLADVGDEPVRQFSGGCAAGWTSPPASSWRRRCCSSTSRRPAWTRPDGATSGRPSGRWWPAVPRCC